jgi:hypothetical protein
MRARITTDQSGYVTLSYDREYCGDTERVTREFMCPATGGYVRELVNGEWRQVCYGLSMMGSTLSASSGSDLLGIIRNEYRAMRRNEKRERKECGIS